MNEVEVKIRFPKLNLRKVIENVSIYVFKLLKINFLLILCIKSINSPFDHQFSMCGEFPWFFQFLNLLL